MRISALLLSIHRAGASLSVDADGQIRLFEGDQISHILRADLKAQKVELRAALSDPRGTAESAWAFVVDEVVAAWDRSASQTWIDDRALLGAVGDALKALPSGNLWAALGAVERWRTAWLQALPPSPEARPPEAPEGPSLDDETLGLVAWLRDFISSDAADALEPFELSPAIRVTEPSRMVRSLLRDLESPQSARCRYGAAQEEVRLLRAHVASLDAEERAVR